MNATTLAVGDEWDVLVLPRISRTTLALFAGASGDHNPIHIDLDVARGAGLDDVFAHGMLSMAYLARFVTENVPQSSIRRLETRFLAITPVGARPRCVGRVEAVETVEGETRARIALSVILDDGTATLAGAAVVSLD